MSRSQPILPECVSADKACGSPRQDAGFSTLISIPNNFLYIRLEEGSDAVIEESSDEG